MVSAISLVKVTSARKQVTCDLRLATQLVSSSSSSTWDFVPRQDFLKELLPYFDSPNVGIVQSPQYFDTSASMNWIERTAGATQEFFYRFIQPSRDKHSAAVCVGSSAVYRRSALEMVGGFPEIDHSEDIYTGFLLGQIGYVTKYVPTVVSKGVCPDNWTTLLRNSIAGVTDQWQCLHGVTFIRTLPSHFGRGLAIGLDFSII